MRFMTVTLSLLALSVTLGCGGRSNEGGLPDNQEQDSQGNPDLGDTQVPDEDLETPEDLPSTDLLPTDVPEDNTPPVDLVELQEVVDIADISDIEEIEEIAEIVDVTEVEEVDAEEVVDPGVCGYQDSVAGLLNCPEGDVDVWVKEAVVTYSYDKGFFVFDGSSTRGMEFYLPAGETPLPSAGDVVNCHVTKFASFKGQQEVTAVASCEKVGAADPFDSSLELVVGNLLPDEQYESRLVFGNGLTVVSLIGNDATVAYGSHPAVPMRLDAPGQLCAGAKFDLVRAVIRQYDDKHQIHVFVSAADILNVNTDECGETPVFDDSNWGFEEIGLDDPPSDFQKVTASFSANRDATVAHTGSASCKLTWTSDTNQDIYQGFYLPVSPGQTVTFSVWVLDQAPGGRVRQGMVFYKDDKSTDGAVNYSSTFSADSDQWVELVHTATAPEQGAYVRGIIRMYDEAQNFNGSAFVHIDDWGFTLQ